MYPVDYKRKIFLLQSYVLANLPFHSALHYY